MDLLVSTLAYLENNPAFHKFHQEILDSHTSIINSSTAQTLSRLSVAWQEADFCLIRDIIDTYSFFLDGCTDPQIQFGIHLVSSAHYCETGRLEQATKQLNLASESLQSFQVRDAFCQTILSVQTAWCLILESRFDAARALLVNNENFHTEKHQENRTVLRAILDFLEGDEASAEAHLLNAEYIYNNKIDSAALAAIQLHRANIYFTAGALALGANCLEQALGWLQRKEYSYLPYWWHPEIMSSILGAAIGAGCCTKQAYRMLTHHQRAIDTLDAHLLPIVTETDQDAQCRAAPIVTKPPIKFENRVNMSKKWRKAQNELLYLIETGFLNEQRLHQLAHKIPHGASGDQLNPAILAVFALHVQQISITEIATRLALATSTVKAYITKIYNAFELSIRNFSSGTDRRALLVEKAISEGYLM